MKRILLINALLILGLVSWAQALNNITPSQGAPGQNLMVTVSGQGTNFHQGSNTVWFSQGSVTYFMMGTNTVYSPNALGGNLYIPYGTPTGVYDLNVFNPVDGPLSLANAFAVQTSGAQIVTVAPNHGWINNTLNVSLSCQNTNFISGSNAQVWFSQGSFTLMGSNTTVINSTQVNTQVTLPYGTPTGMYTTFASNPVDGTLLKASSFYVYPDSTHLINAIVFPNKAVPGGDIDIYIAYDTALHFSYLPPLVNAYLVNGSQVVSIVDLVSNGNILSYGFYGKVQLPNDPAACYDVYVENVDGDLFKLPCGLNMVSPNTARIDSIIAERSLDLINVYGTHTSFLDPNLEVELFHRDMYFVVKSNPVNPDIPIYYDSVVVVSNTHLIVYSNHFFHNTSKNYMSVPAWVSIKNNSSDSLTYPFLPDFWGGIDDVDGFEDLSYFPNPTTDQLTISSPSFLMNEVQVDMYNLSGQKVNQFFFKNQFELIINMKQYPKGQYVLQIMSDKKTKTIKVVVM